MHIPIYLYRVASLVNQDSSSGLFVNDKDSQVDQTLGSFELPNCPLFFSFQFLIFLENFFF